jgi:hypothetical protein
MWRSLLGSRSRYMTLSGNLFALRVLLFVWEAMGLATSFDWKRDGFDENDTWIPCILYIFVLSGDRFVLELGIEAGNLKALDSSSPAHLSAMGQHVIWQKSGGVSVADDGKKLSPFCLQLLEILPLSSMEGNTPFPNVSTLVACSSCE